METKLAPGYKSRVQHVERMRRMRDAAEEMYELLNRLCAAMDEEADNPNTKVSVGQVLFGVCASFEDLRERINA